MSVKVYVTIGVGGWKVSTEVDLCAAPHVGDMLITNDGETIMCESVAIGKNTVYVEQIVRFESEDALKPYLESGWTR